MSCHLEDEIMDLRSDLSSLEDDVSDLESTIDDINQPSSDERVLDLAKIITKAKKLDKELFEDLQAWAFKIICGEK